MPPTQTSSSLPAAPPPKFQEHPGVPPLPFKVWVALFERYIYLVDRSLSTEQKLDDEAKNSYMFSNLGCEAARQFASNPAFESMTTARHTDFSAAVKKQFSAQVHVVRSHFEFQRMEQGTNESVADYLLSLRALAADCNFHGQEEYHLALQLTYGCRDKTAQKQLLVAKEVDLAKFVAILSAEESANASAAAFRGETSFQVHATKFDRKTPARPVQSPALAAEERSRLFRVRQKGAQVPRSVVRRGGHRLQLLRKKGPLRQVLQEEAT